MKVVRVKLSALVEDPGNARVHNDANMKAIRDSLESFEQVEPLVVRKETMIVIGGNGRLAAMKSLGWKECGTFSRALAVWSTTPSSVPALP